MALIEFEEYRQKLHDLKPAIEELGQAYNLEHAAEEVEELENRASEPGFWDDTEKSQKILQRTKALKDKIEGYHNLCGQQEDLLTLCDLAIEMDDDSMIDELREGFDALNDELERRKLATLLLGEYDANNAILSFHAGAGGTEAQDWCDMLYRMYTRWAERHGFSYKILDYLEGDDAGLKSASILIEGENAYGFLKSESGVHRLVRISPFDSSGRRHTSFSAVEVMPEIDDDTEVDIRPEEIDMQVFRSSGAGGQHINKTSSAVRLIHLPTNTVVECQQERSQVQNREKAMRILYSRLYQAQQEAQAAEISAEKRSQVGMGMRNEKIRTYNFPQSRVTDHRIGLTLYKLGEILDGNLDEIIDALITADQAEKLQHSQESDTL